MLLHILVFVFIKYGEIVEQDALISPNPRGELEDLVVVCVLSSCLKLFNSLLKMIQVHFNL